MSRCLFLVVSVQVYVCFYSVRTYSHSLENMELGLIRRSLSHRNDSGSESPFDRKPVHKGTNSSADQALRRKQTRRVSVDIL